MKSLTEMGNKAMQIRDYTEAIKHYDEALEIDDRNVEVLNARLLAFLEMKDFQMALKDAEYWISLDSDSAEVKILNLFLICMSIDKSKERNTVFRLVIEMYCPHN